MKQPLYKLLASKINAIENCRKSGNTEWQDKHTESVCKLVNEYMPHGSGIDSGVRMHRPGKYGSKSNKIMFSFDYHHMRDGFYTHWSSHTLTITPSLVNDFDMRITKDGERDCSFMDYLYQTFQYALSEEVEDL